MAKRKVLTSQQRGLAVPHPRGLPRPREALRGRGERRARSLVLAVGCSEVTALAGSIWVPIGGK